MKVEINNLVVGLLGLNPCEGGVSKLLEAKTEEDILDIFFDKIDFCLAKNFPSNDYLKSLKCHLDAGVVIDRRLVLNDKTRLAILGKSDIELNCTGFVVSRIYVKHSSVLYINACDNAYVVVDALDNAQVYVTAKDKARVVVNLYSNATAIGATKTIHKNKETYDLQTR